MVNELVFVDEELLFRRLRAFYLKAILSGILNKLVGKLPKNDRLL